MNIVLRAAGASLDVDCCMTWIRPDLLSQVWRTGERDVRKRVVQTNGFTLGLAADDDSDAGLRDAYRNLLAVREGIARLVVEGIDIHVDFGMFVSACAPKVLAIPQPLLAELATLGVGLVVSAYPCSDED